MRIAILTPLALEYAAVRPHLPGLREQVYGNDRYERATFPGKHGQHEVLLAQTGSRNVAIGLASSRVITHFQPDVMLLTGIAGGVKDAQIGELVVGTKAYGYDSGKVTEPGLSSRPQVYISDPGLVKLCERIAREGQWAARLSGGPAPRVHFGPIASGDKVIATTQSDEYRHLKWHYNDTLALEMEAIGFAEAVAQHPGIRAINIRCVSDLLDGKNAQHDQANQPTAAARAAAFAIELLYQLDLPATLTTMDPKALGTALAEALLPHLSLPSEGTLQPQLSPQAPAPLAQAWQQLLPLLQPDDLEFIEDASELSPLLRRTIGKTAKTDATAKAQFEALLEALKAEVPGASSVNIVNSKNVVQGGNISVGGDFRVGDG